MPRPKNSEARRDQIARAMLRLLARDGVAGATMRALARESGLAQGLLHYHFASKHDATLAALAEIERRIAARLAAREALGGDPLDALVDALLGPDRPELPADPEALAAWVAIGDAARTDAVLRVAYGDALARLRRAILARLDGPDTPARAAAALCQVEGAWRIGRLAPWAMPAGVAAATLLRMLRAGGESAAAAGDVSPPPTTGDAPPFAGADRVPPPEPPGAPPPAIPAPAELGIRLRARDRACLDRLVRISPIALSPAIWGAVAAAYTAPGRYYHTLEHLAELAASWEAVAAGPGWRDPRASWLALLFHDAVYDVAAGPGVSETRSAALLAALLPETAEPERLIRLTAAHGHEPPDLDADAAHFLDADMAILGAPPARFARYEAQVAAEYAPVVGMDAFRAGRRAFLSGLAAKPRIFGTPFFHDRLDAPARANLARALA